jgi:hypothetical protein
MHTRTWDDVSFRNTFVVRLVTRLPVIATHVHTLKIRHPAAEAETRKRILRTMLEEVVVRAEPGHLRLIPRLTNQDRYAQSRRPRDMMVQGWCLQLVPCVAAVIDESMDVVEHTVR